jgi:hypothetical protein
MYLTNETLIAYGLPAGESDLAARSKALLSQQHTTWPMLQKGASTLGMVVVREIPFEGFSMKLQFNPGRIVSSAAKVDAKSIAERPCFLCLEHLPVEQNGVIAGNGEWGSNPVDISDASNYVVLANPFPIFPEHFTIPHRSHVPQRIRESFPAMLDLTLSMGSRYSLFYNGPRCGASAPDHLHFQAGDFGFMTMDTQWPELVIGHGSWIQESDKVRTAAVDDGLRRFVVIQSDDKASLVQRFETLYTSFDRLTREIHGSESMEEPMFNVLSAFREGKWTIIVFLRRKHRPHQFFAEGDEKILFSPASVDFGGMCITPVERDFDRITRENLLDMFAQLSVTPAHFKQVCNDLR